MRAQKANSVYFSLPTIWWLDTLKRIEKIILESAFDKKTKKPGLKLIPGLALTSVRTRLKQRPVFVTRIFPYVHYKKQMKEACSRQMMKVTFVPCNYGGPGNKGKIRRSITLQGGELFLLAGKHHTLIFRWHINKPRRQGASLGINAKYNVHVVMFLFRAYFIEPVCQCSKLSEIIFPLAQC